MQQQILFVKLNSIELSLDGDRLMFCKKHLSIFVVSHTEKFHKGDTSDLSILDIILIKSALSPSSFFIDDFDISC